MADHKPTLSKAEETAAHAHRDAKLDNTVEDTFPASDPPSPTPPAGTRKAEQIEAAEQAKAQAGKVDR